MRSWLTKYTVGALFAVYGAGVLAVSAFRRMQGNRQFFSEIGEDGLSVRRHVQFQKLFPASPRMLTYRLAFEPVATL